MSQKQYWVVKGKDDLLHVIATIGFVPDGAIGRAPFDDLTGEPEAGDWLQIETTASGNTIVTVDEGKKSEILAARAKKQMEIEREKQKKNQDFSNILQRLDNFNPSQLTSRDKYQMIIKDLVDMIKILTKGN